jgi:hypothetical protein
MEGGMERNKPFDESRGTEVNSDTLEPIARNDGPELEGDFMSEVDDSSVTEDSEEVYFPPVDPPARAGVTNSREGLVAGFEPDSMESMDVDPSASGGPGDEALADAIRRELREDSATADLAVHVHVVEGVAYLHGQVADLDDVENAEDVAGRIPGVREVVEKLEIRG